MGEGGEASREADKASAALAVGSAFGRYQIVRCIGVGGMGSVYEARHTLLKKRVALKTLHQNLLRSESAQARFLREAETLARVRHPNVIDITDLGIEGGIPFLVMELLEGEDLASLLEREGSLNGARAVDLLLPVISGLSAVHRLGIVHRDVKPENIVLALGVAGAPVPKLIDFGVSKELDEALGSRPHTVTGTPQYMAPEQASGSAALDGRADQYAIGVCLYQMLSGKLPYESHSLLELIHLIDCGEHRPLLDHRAELSADLAAVVRRAMARHAIDRFPSMAALGLALLPFASERARQLYAETFSAEHEPRTLNEASERVRTASAPTAPATDPVLGGGPLRRPPTESGVRLRDDDRAAEPSAVRAARARWFAVGGVLGALVLLLLWLFARPSAVAPAVTSTPAGKAPVSAEVRQAAVAAPAAEPVPPATAAEVVAPRATFPSDVAAPSAGEAKPTTKSKARARRNSASESPSDIRLTR